MNCLVLGGAGFIGSHIVDALIAKKHHVKVFDLPNISLHCLKNQAGKFEFVGGNFNNADVVGNALKDIDIVIHLISTTLPGPSNENPVFDIETNLIGSLNLLEKAVQAGVKKVIFASSGGTVYGIPNQVPIPETHPTDPICSYGIGKLAIEKYLALFHHLYGLDYAVLRLGNPYGPRQRIDNVQGVIAVFLGKVLNEKRISIWGDGSVARDYLYISDLANAVVKSMEVKSDLKLFNIGSGKAYTLIEILSSIQKVTGKEPNIDFSPGRKLDVPVNCLKIEKALTELGWHAEIELEEGIKRTWEWIKNELDE